MFTTALALGLTHTLLGPDHYLPFIVIGRARRWSLARTSLLTFVCGLGHVGSSVVLGLVGAAAGAALGDLQGWEETRGGLAAWSLLLFGVGYTLWGLWRAFRPGSHGHTHLHADGTVHRHGHQHEAPAGHPTIHAHPHPATGPDETAAATPACGVDAGEVVSWKQLTPWLLFLIFVLGPCEPLIPLFFADAARGEGGDALGLAVGYGLATLFTMHLLVLLCWLGLRRLPLGPLERFSPARAGVIILVAGVGMVFFGW